MLKPSKQLLATILIASFTTPAITYGDNTYWGMNIANTRVEIDEGRNTTSFTSFNTILHYGKNLSPSVAVEGRIGFPLIQGELAVNDRAVSDSKGGLSLRGVYLRFTSSKARLKPYFMLGYNETDIKLKGRTTVQGSGADTAFGFGFAISSKPDFRSGFELMSYHSFKDGTYSESATSFDYTFQFIF